MKKISLNQHQILKPAILTRRICLICLTLLAVIMGAAMPANTTGQAVALVASQKAVPGMAMPKGGVNLLQFTAGDHVLGFGDKGLYVAAGDHALNTEFVGARRVKPQTDGGSQGASSKASPMERVTYENMWDDVTLVYDRDTGGIVRSTWRIAPHAKGSDPVQSIHLAYNAASVTTDANGNLVLGFASGNMVESAPVAWQEIKGRKVPVTVSFTVSAKGGVGFHVASYDPTRPLASPRPRIWRKVFPLRQYTY